MAAIVWGARKQTERGDLGDPNVNCGRKRTDTGKTIALEASELHQQEGSLPKQSKKTQNSFSQKIDAHAKIAKAHAAQKLVVATTGEKKLTRTENGTRKVKHRVAKN